MKTNSKVLIIAFVTTAISILINVVLIWFFPKQDPSLWVGLQSLIVTMASGAYSIKAKINVFIGREVDLLGVLGVALGIAAAVSPMCMNREFKIPDGCIYVGVSVLGLILLIVDCFRYKDVIQRRFSTTSESRFKETNTEITITTIIKK